MPAIKPAYLLPLRRLDERNDSTSKPPAGGQRSFFHPGLFRRLFCNQRDQLDRMLA